MVARAAPTTLEGDLESKVPSPVDSFLVPRSVSSPITIARTGIVFGLGVCIGEVWTGSVVSLPVHRHRPV